MPESLLYDIFISYSRKDESFVHQLTGKLDEWGFSYWIDVSGIESGDVFKNNIVTAIKSSKVVVFVSSKASNESPWTVKEINYALHKQKPIIPIRIDKAEYNETLQFDLNVVDYVDCTKSTKIQQGFERLYSALQHHFPNHKRQVAQSDNTLEIQPAPIAKKTIIRNVCIALVCLIALGLGIWGIWHATHKQREFKLKINKTGWDEYELKGKVKQLRTDCYTLTDSLQATEIVDFAPDGRILRKWNNAFGEEESIYTYAGDSVVINNGYKQIIIKYTDFGEMDSYIEYPSFVTPNPGHLYSKEYNKYSYNEKNQLKKEENYYQNSLYRTRLYYYNPEGLLVEYKDWVCDRSFIHSSDEVYTKRFEYDENQNIIKDTTYDNKSVCLWSSVYTYNKEGYVSSETQKAEDDDIVRKNFVYEYDQQGNYVSKIYIIESTDQYDESSKEKRTIIYY